MYTQISTSFNASLLVAFISISPLLNACDSPQTPGDISSKHYVCLDTFVAAALPKTDVTIWVPIQKGSSYKRNASRLLAFQDSSMREKSSRISEDLFIRIKAYQELLTNSSEALTTKLTKLKQYPTDRAAVLTHKSNIQHYDWLINAYKRAITLLEEVKEPEPSSPACLSPLVRDFSPWG
jgi:hypothetical protein